MKNKIRLYSVLGLMFAIATFEGFFTGLFDHTHGFNFTQCMVAGAIGAFGSALAKVAGRRLNALEGDSAEWQLQVGRWLFPFLLVAIVPPLGGVCIGYFLRDTPLLAIGLMGSNVVLSPLVYGILTARVAKDRFAHVCFSLLLAWFIALSIYLLTKQSLTYWFAAFPFAALLAVVGYLTAQGLTAIRSRAIAL